MPWPRAYVYLPVTANTVTDELIPILMDLYTIPENVLTSIILIGECAEERGQQRFGSLAEFPT